MRILYETGCTVNELVHLRPEHVDTLTGRIYFDGSTARNSQHRVAVISPPLARLLDEYMRRHRAPFLFSSRQSGAITRRRVRQIVRSCCGKIGLHKHNGPQVLRYTHIAHAYRKNIPVSSIQQQIGMKSTRAKEILSLLSKEDVPKGYERFFDP